MIDIIFICINTLLTIFIYFINIKFDDYNIWKIYVSLLILTIIYGIIYGYFHNSFNLKYTILINLFIYITVCIITYYVFKKKTIYGLISYDTYL